MTKERTAPKTENSAVKNLLANQELKIKHLLNMTDELQNKNKNIMMENETLKQVQRRLQYKKDIEKKFDELKVQQAKDIQVLHEELLKYKKQLRAAEETLKDDNLKILKERDKVRNHEETITHMKHLLARTDLETREELERELGVQRKVAQEAQGRAAQVERNAELTNNLHRKLLLAERKNLSAALEEIAALKHKLKDLNDRLVSEGKVQQKINTDPHSVMKEITKKIMEDNTKKKEPSKREEPKERTLACPKPQSTK